MRNTINLTSLRNIKKVALFIFPIAVMGCSSSPPNSQNQEAKAYLQQLVSESQDVAFMVNFVATERAANCNEPYTKPALEALAMSDPIVSMGTALRHYLPPAVFPAYLNALKVTMNCDSNLWMKDTGEYMATSPNIKADIEAMRNPANTLF